MDINACKKEFDCSGCGPIYPGLQLCAGGIKGQDSCSGDSGSGMFDTLRSKKTKFKLVGVVSWGTSRCGVQKPGVYVKVTAYTKWILDSLRKCKLLAFFIL